MKNGTFLRLAPGHTDDPRKHKSHSTNINTNADGASAGAAATPDESLEPLEISNKKLQPSSQNLCGICYTNERNILTHPCCHLLICISCYKKDSENKKIIKCVYCREKIINKQFFKKVYYFLLHQIESNPENQHLL